MRIANTELEGGSQARDRWRGDEARFRLIVDGLPAVVVLLSPEGDFDHANRHALESLGQTQESMRLWATNDLIHPDDRQEVVARFEAARRRGQPYEQEARYHTTDGTYHWFHVAGFPLRDDEQRVLVWYFLMTDVDDRKRAEEQLRRSEALMSKSQRLGQSGSFSWRPHSGEFFWSEELYRIHQIDPSLPLTLESIAERAHPDDLHVLQQMVERGQAGEPLEYDQRLLLPDGSVKHIHCLAHATRDAQGRLEYIGAVQDVTERRQADKALGELRAELAHVTRVNSLGALTASIAHEINQPLGGIMTNASTCQRMLSAQPPNVEGALETVRRMLRDGRRASDVITRLRAMFSKKVVLADSVDLNEASNEVVELLHSEFRKNRVDVRMRRAHDLPPVTGDRVQLQQVVLNLLLNAIDAMKGLEDRPRQILLITEVEGGDCVRLSVKDVGVGIDQELMGKLFSAFHTTKKDGMGIGLSVSRSIIESHRGRLSAASNADFGATFSFSIPVCSSEATPSNPSAATDLPARPDPIPRNSR